MKIVSEAVYLGYSDYMQESGIRVQSWEKIGDDAKKQYVAAAERVVRALEELEVITSS